MPVTYPQYRDALIERFYDHQLEGLVSKFDPRQPTVILLPGGQGSELKRSKHPYPESQNGISDVVWMDAGVRDGDAKTLEIDVDGKDKDSHVVAAHGPFSFLFTTPYDEIERTVRREKWNYSVFGFDWRRPIPESAGYFKRYVREFRKRILHDHGVDPIKNLTVVCHSMGGMVCTYALTDSNFSGLGFHAIVTVGTPFYGTSTHQERYYMGIDLLNRMRVYGAKVVCEIVASLPGPYTLMFLPRTIYNRDRTRLGLSRYPQIDPNGNTDADPYDLSLLSRWTKAVKEHKAYLTQAKNELIKIAEPIDPNIASVFFNVRSSLDKKTAVELLWKDIDGDRFVYGVRPSPLAGVAGPGDGTVPAWSAWHAHSRPANRYELKRAVDHASLLEHKEVLTLIETIVKTRKLPTRARGLDAKPRAVAGKAKIHLAVDKWAKTGKPPAALLETPVQRGIVASLLAGDKPRMVRRPPPNTRTRKKR